MTPFQQSIRYRQGYKYQLAADHSCNVGIFPVDPINVPGVCTLSTDGTLQIFTGYAWNGASGPAIDTRTFMRGSLIHDVLYQLVRLNLLPIEAREVADALLREICLEDGMWRGRAWWVYHAVRRAGRGATRPSSEPVVLQAP